MKKFKKDEIFYNITKAHPKVKFFANGGQIFSADAYIDESNILDAEESASPSEPGISPIALWLFEESTTDSPVNGNVQNEITPGTHDCATNAYWGFTIEDGGQVNEKFVAFRATPNVAFITGYCTVLSHELFDEMDTTGFTVSRMGNTRRC